MLKIGFQGFVSEKLLTSNSTIKEMKVVLEKEEKIIDFFLIFLD